MIPKTLEFLLRTSCWRNLVMILTSNAQKKTYFGCQPFATVGPDEEDSPFSYNCCNQFILRAFLSSNFTQHPLPLTYKRQISIWFLCQSLNKVLSLVGFFLLVPLHCGSGKPPLSFWILSGHLATVLSWLVSSFGVSEPSLVLANLEALLSKFVVLLKHLGICWTTGKVWCLSLWFWAKRLLLNVFRQRNKDTRY